MWAPRAEGWPELCPSTCPAALPPLTPGRESEAPKSFLPPPRARSPSTVWPVGGRQLPELKALSRLRGGGPLGLPSELAASPYGWLHSWVHRSLSAASESLNRARESARKSLSAVRRSVSLPLASLLTAGCTRLSSLSRQLLELCAPDGEHPHGPVFGGNTPQFSVTSHASFFFSHAFYCGGFCSTQDSG